MESSLRVNLVRVVIAHGNLMAGELIAGALGRQSRFTVVGLKSDLSSLLEQVSSSPIDVALVHTDLGNGSSDAFTAVRRISETCPTVKSVVLMPASERSLVIDAFRAGASGVFCSSVNGIKMLCQCVAKVYEGGIWASDIELGYVMEAFSKTAPLRIVNVDGMRLLTDREEDIVRLVADGLTNREIASRLNLSEHTIKNYLFRMFDKLGVSSRVELVLYAVSQTKQVETATAMSRTARSN